MNLEFRMWNGIPTARDQEKYFYDIVPVMECIQQQMLWDNKRLDTLCYDHISDGSAFEQYTTHKDKNDKKVFVGDILSCPFSNGIARSKIKTKNFNCQVVFQDGAFSFKYEGHDLGNYRVHPFFNECEVIGNIHQHADLLSK